MPVYNSEKFISQAIESILNQTYTNFEFIIINDLSTDNSEQIIKNYKDKRIKYLKNKKNLGEQKTTNIGLQNATGKYIAIMHSDDISLSKRLEIQKKYLDDNKNIFLVGTKYEVINEKNQKLYEPKIKINNFEGIKKEIEKGNNVICHPTIMFRNDKKTKYREKIFYCPDLDLYLQLFKRNKKINIIKKTLLKYRRHPEQITSSKSVFQRRFHLKVLELYIKDKTNEKYKTFNPEKLLNDNNYNLEEKLILNYNNNDYKAYRKEYYKYIKKYRTINKYLGIFIISSMPKLIRNQIIKMYRKIKIL